MKKKIFGKSNMNVAGTSYKDRQGKLMCLRKAESAFLTLRREPKNEHDACAIQVIAHTTAKSGKKSVFCIGYIPADKADTWMAKAMDAGKIVRIAKYNVVGGGKTTLGCEITVNHELFEKEIPDEATAPAEA